MSGVLTWEGATKGSIKALLLSGVAPFFFKEHVIIAHKWSFWLFKPKEMD